MKRAIQISLLITLWDAALAYPEAAHMDTNVGTVLYACSEEETSDRAKGYCTGYIEGVYDSVEKWCVPEYVARGDLHNFIVDGLRTLPEGEESQHSAKDAIMKIIAEKWPCAESQPGQE